MDSPGLPNHNVWIVLPLIKFYVRTLVLTDNLRKLVPECQTSLGFSAARDDGGGGGDNDDGGGCDNRSSLRCAKLQSNYHC